MKRSRYLKIIMAVALSFVFCSCGASNVDSNVKKIGIIQPIEHESLDAARKGFIDGLAEQGYKDGENIRIDYKNANGDQSNNNTIADTFVNDNKDLVLAIGTPSAQSMANKTKKIPILFTAVTEPKEAGLVESNESVGGNLSGTSDKVLVNKQIDLLLEVKPDIKNVGLLYSSAEDNSLFLINEAKQYLKSKNINYIELSVQNSNDIQSVLENSINKIDGLYIPTDNVVASSMPTVFKVTEDKKIPIVPGAVDMVQSGAVGTIGLDYYELGKQTASMAVKILNGETTIDKLPVEYQKEEKVVINEKLINSYGLNLPKGHN